MALGEVMTRATQIIHWPGKDIFSCDKHATRLRGTANAMGFNVSSTIMLDYEINCENCANEEAKNNVVLPEEAKAAG
jgi:hypothetical protein